MSRPWEIQLAELIRERFGFQLDGHSRNVIPRVEEHLAELGLSPGAWLQRLARAGSHDPELRWLVEAFTIGETTFYRDGQQLQGVQDFLRERHAAVGRPLRVWSAACASGEEAYTLAVLMAEAQVPGTVTGTDLNQASLATAQSGGPYSGYRLMPVPPSWRGRWLREGRAGWQPVPTLRSRVRFSRHNLLEPALSISGGWDAVVCRNVLIYFSPETVGEVVERLVGTLADDGLLFLGASDPTQRVPPTVERVRRGTRPAWRKASASSTGRPRLPSAAAPVRSLEQARAAIQSGDLVRARAVLDLHLRATLSDGPALLERGALRLSQHDFAGACADLRLAARSLGRSAEVHYLLGVGHHKQGDAALAARAFSTAIERDPAHWPAMVLLAGLRQQQRQLLQAEELYRTARDVLRRGQNPRFDALSARHISSAHSQRSETRELVRLELDNLQGAQLRRRAP